MLKRTPGIGGKCTREVEKPRQAPGAWHASHPESKLVHSPWGLAAPWTHYGSRDSLAKHVASPSWAQGTQHSGPSTSLYEQRVAQGCGQRHEEWHWDGVGCTQMDRQTDRAAGKGQGKSQTHHQPTGRAQRDWSGELPGAQGGRGEDKSRRYTSGRMVPAPPFLLPAEQHCPLPCQLS